MELKVNDVYRFRYNEEEVKARFEPYWCFDGQLYVWLNEYDGKLYLIDTYWDYLGSEPHGDSKCFTLEKLLEQGTLEFICNLDDVEKCSEHEALYYDDTDVFNLSRQKRCYREFYKRKDAEKSITKIKDILMEDIEYIESKISSLEGDLRWTKEKLASAESGDMNVSISGYRRIVRSS